MLLEEVLSRVRTLPGSQRLRALLVRDEVYGLLPPHPANSPTKRPLVALMKQARALGLGVVVATLSPMDLGYRGLSTADEALGATLTRLAPRWFVVRNAHATSPPTWCNRGTRYR